MQEVLFYLFSHDELFDVIRVCGEKVSRGTIRLSALSTAPPDASPHSTSVGKVANFVVIDSCKLHSPCGDGDCSCSDGAMDYYSKKIEQRKPACKVLKRNIQINRYQLSYFYYLMEQSPCYRLLVIKNFAESIGLLKNYSSLKFKIRLEVSMPCYHILDYIWCRRLERLCFERQELETAMAWLSTLGGAFSALGDKEEQCAVIAGKISEQQLKNALRLGDPFTVARCKLYFSLSLIQQRKFSPAKRIIKEQYQLAIANAEKDFKLVRMCLGIWSKLKYEKKYKKRSYICQ